MRRKRLAAILLLATLAGCARHAEVVSDPGAVAPGVLVVANQTDWELLIELVPEGDPAGALTLGQVPAGQATAFENVPARRPFTLRASIPGSTRMVLGPTREFDPGARWEWLLRPGPEWGVP